MKRYNNINDNNNKNNNVGVDNNKSTKKQSKKGRQQHRLCHSNSTKSTFALLSVFNFILLLKNHKVQSFRPTQQSSSHGPFQSSYLSTLSTSKSTSKSSTTTARQNWLRDFFEPPKSSSSSSSSLSRQVQYPEQYPATYEINTDIVLEDNNNNVALLVRPLLKNTQLQSRPLQIVYDANQHGWNPTAFHNAVDGKGAAIVIAKTATISTTDNNGRSSILCGGYNPKGWASLGGARPSVAAFLFYQTFQPGSKTITVTTTTTDNEKDESSSSIIFQKLQKVGGGGLACARDDFDFGISFGPDGFVVPLRQQQQNNNDNSNDEQRRATSKLGPYFERGPDNLSTLFPGGAGVTKLTELKVLVGVYEPNEDIPYSGGVLDMTSG